MSEIQKMDVSSALVEYYTPYAKYVAQTRALCDSRDGLKQGARFILYAQYLDKLTYKHKARKAVDTIAASMKFSVHGDAAIIGNAVRMSQPFSMRYPLIYVKGNNGSQIDGSSVFSAPRYLEMFSNEIAGEMLSLLEKETIDTWEWNYTQEKQYPTVLPSIFPNFINGSIGLGVGISSAIPQWNLKEVCGSAIKLLNNPQASFEELYCAPDFCTGGILMNESEVKDSLKTGKGKSAILRSKIEYHQDKRELVAVELPYLVTSSQILAQIQKAIEEKTIIGIDSAFDSSDISGVKIVIKLLKGASAESVLKSLYKETSLQSHYPINMNMLKNGTTPKLFSFVEILTDYLEHMKLVLHRSLNYDLKKTVEQLEILSGLSIAIANIDEIVSIIKSSSKKEEAKKILIERFQFTENQVEVILDLKLQRLVGLEGIKLNKEKKDKEEELQKIQNILSSEENFKSYVIEQLKRISDAYGDSRRTEIYNVKIEADEIIENKKLLLYFTNFNNLLLEEVSTLITQKRGGRGAKIKLQKGEEVVKTISVLNNTRLILFSNIGRVYAIPCSALLEQTNIELLLQLQPNEKIIEVTTEGTKKEEFVIFVTKQGYVKKSDYKEYSKLSQKGSIGIKLREGDFLVKILFLSNEKIGILTKEGFFKIIETVDINSIGKNSVGVIGIKLGELDEVVDSGVITAKNNQIIFVSSEGYAQRIDIKDLPILGRTAKGKKIQKGILIGFIAICLEDKEIAISSAVNIIKVSIDSIPQITTGGTGVKIIALNNNNITGVIKTT